MPMTGTLISLWYLLLRWAESMRTMCMCWYVGDAINQFSKSVLVDETCNWNNFLLGQWHQRALLLLHMYVRESMLSTEGDREKSGRREIERARRIDRRGSVESQYNADLIAKLGRICCRYTANKNKMYSIFLVLSGLFEFQSLFELWISINCVQRHWINVLCTHAHNVYYRFLFIKILFNPLCGCFFSLSLKTYYVSYSIEH